MDLKSTDHRPGGQPPPAPGSVSARDLCKGRSTTAAGACFIAVGAFADYEGSYTLSVTELRPPFQAGGRGGDRVPASNH